MDNRLLSQTSQQQHKATETKATADTGHLIKAPFSKSSISGKNKFSFVTGRNEHKGELWLSVPEQVKAKTVFWRTWERTNVPSHGLKT